MQKVLLLDTNISSLPIYNALENAGYDVYVAGANPEDYLARSAKNYIEVDYSDATKVNELISSIGFSFLVPGCNDLSYKICAEVNSIHSFFGLDSLENTLIINDKRKFRDFAISNQVPVPKVFGKEECDGSCSVIVKPVDAYSGRGVTVIAGHQLQELDEAISSAVAFSKTGQYIIEEFVEGQLYSHSTFIKNGEIFIDFIVEEFGSANQFAVDTSRVVYDFDPEMLEVVRTNVLKIVKILELTDGLFHTQFILENKSLWFIEVTRRCPGDLYSQLIELSTGYPYAMVYAQFFLDKSVPQWANVLFQKRIMRHTISVTTETLFSALQFKVSVEIEKLYILCESGKKIPASPYGRIGLLFLKTNSDADISNLINITVARKLYEVY